MTAPRLILGDCVEAMREMEEASVDAVVTDPPYGLEFMGKEWDSFRASENPSGRQSGSWAADRENPFARAATPRYAGKLLGNKAGPMRVYQEWCEAWAEEALRVLKPGGHLVAFGGTRTYHRLACALEDAGFEIRDCLAWMYGSGFPKSLSVSKALDALAGEARPVVGRARGAGSTETESLGPFAAEYDATAPATPDAERWEGWGTALKPAHEPVVLARKPLVGTVAANVLAHGTGAVNVDGCRIDTAGNVTFERAVGDRSREDYRTGTVVGSQVPSDLGRWPANVLLGHHEDCVELDCHPDCPVRLLDEQSGKLRGGVAVEPDGGANPRTIYSPTNRLGRTIGFGDSGGASRFFYTAKASGAERDAGLDDFDLVERANGNKWTDQDYRVARGERTPGRESGPRRNHHPTVKPVALMRWLARLVTPPGGTVLDPFLGSGTTGIAAALEGFDFVGVERDPEYLPIAEARIAFWREHGEGALALVAEREAGERRRAEVTEAGQLDIFEGAA